MLERRPRCGQRLRHRGGDARRHRPGEAHRHGPLRQTYLQDRMPSPPTPSWRPGHGLQGGCVLPISDRVGRWGARERPRPPSPPMWERLIDGGYKGALAQLFRLTTFIRTGVELDDVHAAHLRFSNAAAGAGNPECQRKPDDRWCWRFPPLMNTDASTRWARRPTGKSRASLCTHWLPSLGGLVRRGSNEGGSQNLQALRRKVPRLACRLPRDR